MTFKGDWVESEGQHPAEGHRIPPQKGIGSLTYTVYMYKVINVCVCGGGEFLVSDTGM